MPQGSPPMADAEALIRTHQAGIWRYLRLLGAPAADAEDLLQETFLRVLRRNDDREVAAPMLRTIARGLWIDRHRWLQRQRAVQWADEVDRSLAGHGGDADGDAWLDALAACRQRLTARAQRALDLTYRDGCDRRTVARELGLAANTARNLLATARDTLRRCIERHLQADEGAQS